MLKYGGGWRTIQQDALLLSSTNTRIRAKPNMTDLPSETEKSEIIAMALSDHASFQNIRNLYGLLEKDVKKLMRASLKTGSYQAWRKRVRAFSDRREHYK